MRLMIVLCLSLIALDAEAQTQSGQQDLLPSSPVLTGTTLEGGSALVLQGLALMKDGKTSAARDVFMDHLRQFGPTTEVFGNIAEAERLLGKPAVAADFAQRAIDLDAANALAYAHLARARYDLGDDAGSLAAFDEAIRLKPNEASWILDRGNTRFRASDFDGAMADYDAAQRLLPGWAVPYANRSFVHLRKERWVEAESEARLAIAQDPNFGDAHRNLGYALQGLGTFADALVAFDTALATGARPQDVLPEKATTLEKLNSLDAALATANEALKLDPRQIEMLRLKLRIAKAKNRPNDMRRYVKDALSKHLQAPNEYVSYAQELTTLGQQQLAYDVLRAGAKSHPDAADILLDLGWAARDLGKKEEALRSMIRLTELVPQRGANWADRATIESEMGQHEAAFRHYEQAIALEPDNALIRYNLGWAHMRKKDYMAAQLAMLEGHRLDPGNININIDLGYVADVVGNSLLAEKHARLALQAEPDNITALSNLSDILARTGGLAEARAVAQKARALDPKNPELIVGVAFTLLLADEVAGAADLMREARALQSKSRSVTYYYVLGLLREKQGRKADAIENYGLVLKGDPNEYYRRHAEDGLKRLK